MFACKPATPLGRGAGSRNGSRKVIGSCVIVVPTDDDLGALGERMAHYGLDTRDDGRGVEVDDPWGNLIRVLAASSA